MPIQLDRILGDIAEEKVLHPNYPDAAKKDVDEAWTRVGKNNKLSVHEARSIFKVLQKKYEQEKLKGASSWKLFSIMEDIHRKVTKPTKQEDPDIPMEEDEEYEMLEVQEEEEQTSAGNPSAHSSGGSTSDGESPSKSMQSNSSTGSPEKDEKPLIKTLVKITTPKSMSSSTASPVEEKKLLNSLVSASPRQSTTISTAAPQTPSATTAAALQKKGITLKKTTPSTPAGTARSLAVVNTAQLKNSPARAGQMPEVGKTIQLPESIKRKLSQDQPTTPQTKRINIAHVPAPQAVKTPSPPQMHNQQHTTTTQLMQVKQDREDQIAQSNAAAAATHGINLITIPANPTRVDLVNGLGGGATSSTAATVASTSTNGFSPRIEDIDFRSDIIFDTGSGVNGTGSASHKVDAVSTSDIINLGNFDNSLPPTFFKNLCNSSRHEALGLYVANVMNRLRARSAAKLELGILRAIIDVQSDELEQ